MDEANIDGAVARLHMQALTRADLQTQASLAWKVVFQPEGKKNANFLRTIGRQNRDVKRHPQPADSRI